MANKLDAATPRKNMGINEDSTKLAANSRCPVLAGYAATVEDELLTIRPNMSGSGGWWFIRVVGGSYCVFETDQYGGDSYHLSDFESISDALELANSLA